MIDNRLREMLKESWDDGYQTSVDKLRAMANHLADEDIADVVRMLATALESDKP